ARELTLERMMAAGMHLGHSKGLWNPMNLPFIFGERQGIHIINLEHTMAALRRAAQFVKQTAYHGGLVLFVGTRREHRQLAIDAALESSQYFVSGRWTPGTITNQKSLFRRHFIYAKDARPQAYKPDLIISLSPRESRAMLYEARKSFVPTVGIIDTNSDPTSVTYPIPCNDDSPKAVAIVAGILAKAAKSGMELRKHRLMAAAQKYNQKAVRSAAALDRVSQIYDLNE
ncbi:ribosomal protein S2, flavodoxin-like domain-containing protein, partial [Coemansia mojavensis]